MPPHTQPAILERSQPVKELTMAQSLIVSILGPDRPGIVKTISDCAKAHNANWADSMLATYAGHFAGIIHLHVPPQNAAALVTAIEGLNSASMRVMHVEARDAAAAALRELNLKVVGNDRPGIVNSIANALARLGVNIRKLQSRIASAPMAGSEIFYLRADLAVPESVDESALKAALEALADELMVDIDTNRDVDPSPWE
jgi:glycine cleavage system regulatory protein